jgi:hypothetical protein
MLAPTYDWCSGVYGSRLPYTPLDHYTGLGPHLTQRRILYTQIKLLTIPQESSFQLQHTQLFYTNCENNKVWALYTVKITNNTEMFLQLKLGGKENVDSCQY